MNPQGLVTGVSLGSAYAIGALGLTLVFRVTRVLNLAHGAVMMGVGLFLAHQGYDSPWALLAVGIPLGAAMAAVVHLLTIQPFRNRDHVTRLAVLVGVLFAAGGLAQRWAGTDSTIFSPLIAGYWQIPGGATLGKHALLTLCTVFAVVLIISSFLNRTTMGKSMKAIAEDPRGAVLIGISVGRLLLITAIISGVLAGLAAVLIVPQTGTSFNAGFGLTVASVVSAVIGGLRSVWGAVIGGLLIGIGQGLMLQYYPQWYGTLQFGLLIVVLGFRPQGLLGATK